MSSATLSTSVLPFAVMQVQVQERAATGTLGLLGAMAPSELIQAIVHADLRRLTQAPGVGKRTAERLAVELRSRLQKRFSNQLDASSFEGGGTGDGDGDGDGDGGPAIDLDGASRDEVHLTLGALGYEALEIQRAMRAVAGLGLGEGAGAEDWIRECLRWLSRDVA